MRRIGIETEKRRNNSNPHEDFGVFVNEPTLPLTEFLNRGMNADSDTDNEAFARLHEELQAIARNHLRNECSDHSWEPSDLVSECYLRIFGRKPEFVNRFEFYRIVTNTMRQLLVDYARRRSAQKRGGEVWKKTSIEWCYLTVTHNGVDVAELNEALSSLADASSIDAEVIKLRYFGGMKWEEIALLFGCSEAKVRKDAKRAEAFLRRALDGDRRIDE
ncbi:ECF-type sigma factor [Rhodopirellula sallentina]|uniref:RNA polymerase sigma-70 ECF-like protein n=1 Tax=Rhodopirellula sallentina SM41 TaxID=1263870 RepID=M5U607_9BACT|nr:ECF-type sigma factor [Rhodopirellula sallentina]EMI56885.1 RNA polymerase sigma-70 ECF-like protein [Rhodopirellula sallentina SM41]